MKETKKKSTETKTQRYIGREQVSRKEGMNERKKERHRQTDGQTDRQKEGNNKRNKEERMFRFLC